MHSLLGVQFGEGALHLLVHAEEDCAAGSRPRQRRGGAAVESSRTFDMHDVSSDACGTNRLSGALDTHFHSVERLAGENLCNSASSACKKVFEGLLSLLGLFV